MQLTSCSKPSISLHGIKLPLNFLEFYSSTILFLYGSIVRRSLMHACHGLLLHAFHRSWYHSHCHLSSLSLLTFSLSLSFVPSYLLQAFLLRCRLPALWVYRDDFILEHSLPVQWAAVDYLHLFPPSLVPVDTAIDTWDARLSMGHSNCFPFSPWVTKNLRLPSINP